jgi:hypothetical protein
MTGNLRLLSVPVKGAETPKGALALSSWVRPGAGKS